MQDELAALSSDAVHMTAVKAGHNVHLDEPLLVVQAIRDLVDRCRELRAGMSVPVLILRLWPLAHCSATG
jgi:hypothetical protein